MKEQQAIDAIVKECIDTWQATVQKAADAGYSFCTIGYFEIPDREHSVFHEVLTPLFADIESKGAQALEFRPNLDCIYDQTGQKVVAYAKTPWAAPLELGHTVPSAREVRLLSNEYVRTRDVTESEDPKEFVHGLAFPYSEVPTFRTHAASEHIIGAVGVCWRNPRLH